MAHPSSNGQILVSGQPFDDTLAFFVDQVGFRMDLISPADDPALAVLSGFGLTLCLDRSVEPAPLTIRLATGEHGSATAPNGVVVEFVQPPDDTVVVPDLVPELVIARAAEAGSWVTGRAGMRYRDLIPSRLGGRFIASHIEICDGGPVPDLVHHHGVRFQMIFCHRGWVDVVYEDQGPPFRLEAGDCVLQPPHIRHRVLESSAGAQVVEIGCPAEHDTLFDYDMQLPTSVLDLGGTYGGQQFVRHVAAEAPWTAAIHPGFEAQHTEIDNATNGLASVCVIRASDKSGAQAATAPTQHDGEFWFLFVLEGSAGFAVDGSTNAAPLSAGDSVTVPAGLMWSLRDASPDLAMLQVTLPA